MKESVPGHSQDEDLNQRILDKKLDELNFHKKEMERLNLELIEITTEKVNSENNDDIRFAAQFAQDPVSNPIQQKIKEEEIIIRKINQELQELL